LNHGDEVQVGLVRFEMQIHDAPAKGNDATPDEGKSPDVSPRVEGSVAPVPEPTQLNRAPSESPVVPVEPGNAPATQEDFDQVQRLRSEQMEPASEFATDTLMRFFTCRNAHDDQHKAPAAVTPKRKKPPWWMLVDADGEVNPNIMFVLGILVGIGLSTAANTFWMISGQPADTPAMATAPTATPPAAAVDSESLATREEEGD
jgi:hypothetical protein